MHARRERFGVHRCVCRNVGIRTRIRRRELSSVFGHSIRAASTEPQAQSHGCWDGRLPCCPLQETLNALPDILFLHDPEKMVPLFGCTGCIKKLPGGFRASGKPHPVDAAWNALSNPQRAWWNWCLIQWAAGGPTRVTSTTLHYNTNGDSVERSAIEVADIYQ